jgi:hypothetical protein
VVHGFVIEGAAARDPLVIIIKFMGERQNEGEWSFTKVNPAASIIM